MSTVTFSVPYFFDATYVPKGKRKSVGAMFGRMMDVEIESVSSDEAPVAVTLTRDDGIEVVVRDYVAYEGKFYSKETGSFWRSSREDVHIDGFGPRNLECYASRALDRLGNGEVNDEPDGEFYSIGNHVNPEHWDEVIERARDEIREAASRVVFVDGILHRRTELPTIVARISYTGRVNRIAIDIGELEAGFGAHGSVFNLDEKGAAVAWSEDRQSREHACEIDDYLTVEVYEPALIPDTTLRADEALRVVGFLLAREIDLKEQTDEYLMAFVRARRAYNAARAEPTDDTVGEMFDAWEALYRQFALDEAPRRARYSSSFDLEDDLDFKALMGQRKAWEDRPILETVSDIGFQPQAIRR